MCKRFQEFSVKEALLCVCHVVQQSKQSEGSFDGGGSSGRKIKYTIAARDETLILQLYFRFDELEGAP